MFIFYVFLKRAQSSCAVNACLKEAKQNRMGNVFQVSPSNVLSCFYASGKVAVFYHTSLCASLCTGFSFLFFFFFKWASRNKCVIQRECQLFTLNNVRGLKGCRGALGLKQTCDIWSKSQKSILLLLGKSNQGLNQVTPHRLNHTNNKKIVIPASWPLHFLFTISSLILFLWC